MQLADMSSYSDAYDLMNIVDAQGDVLYRVPGSIHRLWKQCHPDLPFEEFVSTLEQRYTSAQSSNTGPIFTVDVRGINAEEIAANAMMSREESARYRISAHEQEPKKSTLLAQQAPASTHYKTMPIEPLQYAEANGLGVHEFNVVKYVSRWRQKGGIEDLKKAEFYIRRLIELNEEVGSE